MLKINKEFNENILPDELLKQHRKPSKLGIDGFIDIYAEIYYTFKNGDKISKIHFGQPYTLESVPKSAEYDNVSYKYIGTIPISF